MNYNDETDDGLVYEQDRSPRDPTETAKEAMERGPDEMPFHVEGLLPEKSLVMLTGSPKASGKTELMLRITKALAEGSSFLGHSVEQTPVMYLSEMPHYQTKTEYMTRIGLKNEDAQFVWPTEVPHYDDWPDLVDAVSYYGDERNVGVVVVDTFSHFAGLKGEEENMPGPTQNAVGELQRLRDEIGATVVMVHHNRKSGGAVHEAARGSTAITASVDVILSMSGPEKNQSDTTRSIQAMGRVSSVVSEMTIDLTDDGYVRIDNQTGTVNLAIRDALGSTSKDARTKSDICDVITQRGLNVTERTVGRRLKGMENIERIGEGKRNDPYRYYQR